jgi:DNA repair photolyase
MGTVRVSRLAQLRLAVGPGSGGPRELTVLDELDRGTQFLSIGVRSVLNSPASTGMGFWSLNPYVGCEFGCTYCYARDTHRYATERAEGRTGGGAGGDHELPPWLAFEKRILGMTDIAERLARALDAT